MDDAGDLARIFIAAWHDGYRGVVAEEVIDALDSGQWETRFATVLSDPAWTTTVAVERGRPVGFARYGPDVERPGTGHGHIAALYVDPSASGSGVGACLVETAIDNLAAASRGDVSLWVFRDNHRARRLYQRNGFRFDGTTSVNPEWGAAQVRYRRRPANRARQLPPLPDLRWGPIRALDIEALRLPLRETFRSATREVRTLSAWSVRLRSADGFTASATTVATPQITGDTDTAITTACAGPLRDAVLGVGGLHDGLAALAATPIGVPSARAAVDVALHRLGATVAGTTLTSLLGAGNTVARTGVTVSLDAPEIMAAAAADRLAEGFTTLKLKLGDAANDVARVTAVAAVTAERPGTVLRLDANQAWTVAEAIGVLDALAEADIPLELVEQPVGAADLDGMAQVAARSPWPLLADESCFDAADVTRIADAGAASIVNLKVLKAGGLGPARAIVETCRAAGVGLLVGCMLEPLAGVDAAGALAATASVGPMAHDLDAGWWTTPASTRSLLANYHQES